MRNLIRRFYDTLRSDGPVATLRRGTEFGLRRLYFAFSEDPTAAYHDSIAAITDDLDINICLNELAREQYDPAKTNVLIATEGPAAVEAENWLDPDMDFHAEFSFGDFYDLEHFYSLRRMHAGRDYRVKLDLGEEYTEKPDLASIVFADKDRFEGQAMRHRVAADHADVVDAYGSGVGSYLYEKPKSLTPYRFQVVIEACKRPEYVSEKFFDCLKTNTVPIYWGGRQAVEKMGFDTEGILFFEDMDDLAELLADLSADDYDDLRPHAETNRERLVEIRNRTRSEFYLNRVRLGFLQTSDDTRFERTRPHLRLE